jgi:hypothetical protein
MITVLHKPMPGLASDPACLVFTPFDSSIGRDTAAAYSLPGSRHSSYRCNPVLGPTFSLMIHTQGRLDIRTGCLL